MRSDPLFAKMRHRPAALEQQPVRRSFIEGGFTESAKLEKAIRRNLKELGYDICLR